MEELLGILGKLVSVSSVKNVLEPFDLIDETDDDPEEEAPIGSRSWVDRERGIEIEQDNVGAIKTIFLHSDAHESFSGFKGPLIGSLSFASSRDAVRAELGEPTRSKDAFVEDSLGPQGAWDRFESPQYTIHIQYDPDTTDRIRLITLMNPDVVP
ncbi:MAG: hypothetical protein QF918_02885 [Pirellulaceae bacterium]|jgi:hypothetical protein|nr:hypothetical protein [Pirellulaceae bacterium]MDP6553809.1 hypothetical protein [Pirellulaceae bacterium]